MPFCRQERDRLVLGIEGQQEVRFQKYGAAWGQLGFFVRTAPGFDKWCLRTRYCPSFIGGQFYESLAQSVRVRRTADAIHVTFRGACERPLPHALTVEFSVRAGSPFIRRRIELIPRAAVALGTHDLAFTLIRNREGYIHERLILGLPPDAGETHEAPRWQDPDATLAFAKELNLDLFDMLGLPALVTVFRGESPFCLVYLKHLPAGDPMRHLVARNTVLESEVGAGSTRCRVAADQPIVETSYWRLFHDPGASLETLIPLATSAYWDLVEPFPEKRLGRTPGWMETAAQMTRDLFRPKAFGPEPVPDDDPTKGWTVYTVEEHGVGKGTPMVLLQYWGDYLFRFSRLTGQEALRRRVDPLFANALRYLRRDDPWCRAYWQAPSGKSCVTFFDMERMRCALPLASAWDDRELLDHFGRFMEPFIARGGDFLDDWRAEARRLERQHAATDAAYYAFFPGLGWAYAAAGNFALAAEVRAYGRALRADIRRTVVAMVRRLNAEVRFAEMSQYLPRNTGLLPLGWSVYANVRVYEFSGDPAFLDAAEQRLHWVLSLGNFRNAPDDPRSRRPIRTDDPLHPGYRRRNANPAVDTLGWLVAGSHERWHAPSEMWQMAPLLAPLLALRPDPTGLRFLALMRQNMPRVFPGNCEMNPDEPLWIPFEFPLSRKGREQYGAGPLFQAALVFEAFARPDNGRVLAFSPSTLYGEHLAARPRVVLFNPTTRDQTCNPRLRGPGQPMLRQTASATRCPYDGKRLTLAPGEHIEVEFQVSINSSRAVVRPPRGEPHAPAEP